MSLRLVALAGIVLGLGGVVALARSCEDGTCTAAAASDDSELQSDDLALLQRRGKDSLDVKALLQHFPACKFHAGHILDCPKVQSWIENHLSIPEFVEAMKSIRIPPASPGKPSARVFRDFWVKYYTAVGPSMGKAQITKQGVVDCTPFHLQPGLYRASASLLQEAQGLRTVALSREKAALKGVEPLCPESEIPLPRPRLKNFRRNRLEAFTKTGKPNGGEPEKPPLGSLNLTAAVPSRCAGTRPPGYTYSLSPSVDIPGTTQVDATLGVGGLSSPLPVNTGSHVLNQLWWTGSSVQNDYLISLEAGWILSDYFNTEDEQAITMFAFSTPDDYKTPTLCPKEDTGDGYNYAGGFIQVDSVKVLGTAMDEVTYKVSYIKTDVGYQLELTPFILGSDGAIVDYEDSINVGFWPSDRYCFEVEGFTHLQVGLEVSAPETGTEAAGTIFGWGFTDASGVHAPLNVNGQFCSAPTEEGWFASFSKNPEGFGDRVQFSGSYSYLPCIAPGSADCAD